MNTEHLRTFITVADSGSFSRAAGTLRLSQGAVSQQVRSLERDLGLELFAHAGRTCRLTEAGRLFLDRARAIVAMCDSAVADAREALDGGPAAGATVIAYAPECGSNMTAKLSKVFWSERPESALCYMRFESAGAAVESVGSHVCDAALCLEPSRSLGKGLSFWPIAAVAEYCMVESESNLGSKASLSIDDLGDALVIFRYPIGSFAGETRLRAMIKETFPGKEIAEYDRTMFELSMRPERATREHAILAPQVCFNTNTTSRSFIPLEGAPGTSVGLVARLNPSLRVRSLVSTLARHYREHPGDTVL